MDLRNVKQGMTRVHLDFHTPAEVGKIAQRFHPDEFADTLAEAHVDSVVVFAKCHHGYSYYKTKVGTMHPGLDFDLMGEMISACHKRGILVPVYYTVVWDELAAREHPDWRQVDADGNPVDKVHSQEFATAGWASLCMNSPYVDEILIPATKEILTNYEADGLWYDIVWFHDESCFCRFCIEKMKKLGLDPGKPDHQHSFTRDSVRDFVRRTSETARSIRPNLSLDYNGRTGIGCAEHIPFVTNLEIEALPSTVGHLYFPIMSRHIRTRGLPFSGLTCRFTRMWGDFGTLKTVESLRYEAAVMLSCGARVSVGDQLHPDGKLRRPAYDVIGTIFSEVHAKRKWSEGATPVANIALLARRPVKRGGTAVISDAVRGASAILLQLHHQFNVIDDESDLEGYDLVVVPGTEIASPQISRKLDSFISRGGKLLATAQAASSLGRLLGVEATGQSPNPREYIRPRGELAQVLPAIDHVVYGPPTYVKASGGDVLADTIPPYFPRARDRFFSHKQTPPMTHPDAQRPAVTLSPNAAYIAHPVFASHARQPNPHLKRLLEWLLDKLIPRVVVTDLPGSVDVSVMRKGDDLVAHVVPGPSPREERLTAPIESLPSYRNVTISVKLARKPAGVYLAPERKDLVWTWEEGRAVIRLEETAPHTLVVFERGA